MKIIRMINLQGERCVCVCVCVCLKLSGAIQNERKELLEAKE